MRRGILACLVLLAMVGAGVVHAASFVRFETVTVADTAIGFTAATMLDPPGQPQSNFCQVTLAGAEVRFRFDGVAPTSTVGTPLQVGDVVVFNTHEDAQRAKFIRTGAVSGTLSVHCGVK